MCMITGKLQLYIPVTVTFTRMFFSQSQDDLYHDRSIKLFYLGYEPQFTIV